MKKVIPVFISMIMVLSLMISAGCGGRRNDKVQPIQPMTQADPQTQDDSGTDSNTDGSTGSAENNLNVGDIIEFGSWELDGNATNGPESIRWIVISSNDSDYYLMSEYILDSQPFNETDEPVTWETCTLRKWLNETFLNQAFTKDEQALIIKSHNEMWYNDYYHTDGGNATDDLISLPSADMNEDQYRWKDEARFALSSRNAYLRGVELSDRTAYGWYWVTGGAFNYNHALYVNHRGTYYDGGTDASGEPVDAFWVGVRPCIRISNATIPYNSANQYEDSSEGVLSFIGEFEQGLEELYQIPTEIDAEGFATKKEAEKALAEAIKSFDTERFIELMPWPFFYRKYVKEYMFSVRTNNDIIPYDRAELLSRLQGFTTKMEQYEFLCEHGANGSFGKIPTFYVVKPFDKYVLDEFGDSDGHERGREISELFPDAECTAFRLMPRDSDNDSWVCYLICQDDTWYAFWGPSLTW